MDSALYLTPKEFNKWLEKNHLNIKEQYIGFYKKSTGKQIMTWSESVDEALCYGWIDGLKKSIDGERYVIRFTPRKNIHNWSDININKMMNLIDENRMKIYGIYVFQPKKPN
jgi:uncharacterized protein YdeI (YjbR/CyaY-like superfamily)